MGEAGHESGIGAGFGSGRSAAVVATGAAGAECRALLTDFFRVRGYAVEQRTVPDTVPATGGAAPADSAASAPRFVFTAGGVGLRPGDTMPEATAGLLDYQVPGLLHAVRRHAAGRFPETVLSRGVAGVSGRTLIVNLPGTPGALADALAVLAPLLAHLQDQLEDVHGHGPREAG